MSEETKSMLSDWRFTAIEIEKELRNYDSSKVTIINGKSEFHLGFRLCREWIQKHYYLIYKNAQLPIQQDEADLQSENTRLKEVLAWADEELSRLKTGKESQLVERIAYLESQLAEKDKEMDLICLDNERRIADLESSRDQFAMRFIEWVNRYDFKKQSWTSEELLKEFKQSLTK